MTTTVGIVGYVEETRRFLESHLQRPDLRLVNIISREEIMIHGPDYPFEERLETGLNRLRESGATAVITYWDFPANLLTAFIANRAGLPYASIEAVMKCEHKYWFRRVQTRVAHAPEFCAFHPFRDDPWAEITLKYPFWVKPVVGHSSMLGFEVRNDEDFERALAEIRDGVEDLTKPFHYALDHTKLPEDLQKLGSTLCVAEEIISEGRQYTLEG